MKNINVDITNRESPLYYKNMKKSKLTTFLQTAAKKSFHAKTAAHYFPCETDNDNLTFLLDIPHVRRARRGYTYGKMHILMSIPVKYASNEFYNAKEILNSIVYSQYVKDQWVNEDEYFFNTVKKFSDTLREIAD